MVDRTFHFRLKRHRQRHGETIEKILKQNPPHFEREISRPVNHRHEGDFFAEPKDVIQVFRLKWGREDQATRIVDWLFNFVEMGFASNVNGAIGNGGGGEGVFFEIIFGDFSVLVACFDDGG